MKKQTMLNKIDELMLKASLTNRLNKVREHDGYVTYEISCYIRNYNNCYDFMISFNTQAPNMDLDIQINETYKGFSYNYSKTTGEFYRTSASTYHKEITEQTYDRTFNKAYNQGIELLNAKLKVQERKSNKTVAEKAAAIDNTVTMECNDTLTADNFDYQSAHKIEQLADKLDINDCIEYINDLLTEYEIGYGCYTFDQLKAIYKYTLNKQDIKEFCLKLQTCYSEYDLDKELITDNLCMFNLELLTCEDVYIYDSAEEYLQYFLENYGEGASEFYDNIIYYLLDADKIVEYIEQSEYYPFYWTNDGQLIQVCY